MVALWIYHCQVFVEYLIDIDKSEKVHYVKVVLIELSWIASKKKTIQPLLTSVGPYTELY